MKGLNELKRKISVILWPLKLQKIFLDTQNTVINLFINYINHKKIFYHRGRRHGRRRHQVRDLIQHRGHKGFFKLPKI